MDFTQDEKKFLLQVVTEHLDSFKKDAEKVMDQPDPAFYAGELRYEEFLERLLKKLK